jgi:2-(1,2-epoxy-1,2-dihydrophenyl)acetyl-CoA isomerase
MSDVTRDRDGDVTILTIDRPEKRNALGSRTASELADAIEEEGRSARVLIVTGAGGAFSAGGDLEELAAWVDEPEEAIAKHLYGSFQAMIRNLRAAPAVAIAAVDGPAIGAGMDLALACDFRIASDRARFGQVWVKLGLIPGTGGAWLTQMLAGPAAAAELLLTGDIIDAARALELGLVNRVVPPGELLDEARSLAETLLRRPREGLIESKRAMVVAQQAALDAALNHAAAVQPGRFRSDEFKSALKEARER